MRKPIECHRYEGTAQLLKSILGLDDSHALADFALIELPVILEGHRLHSRVISLSNREKSFRSIYYAMYNQWLKRQDGSICFDLHFSQ